MENSFYITERDTPQGKWYNLRVLPTHYCISAGDDLNRIGEIIKKYVRDFSNEPTSMLRALSQLSSGGKVSKATFEQCEVAYKEHGKDYYNFICDCVKGVKAENKAKFYRKFASKKKIVSSGFSSKEVLEEVIEEAPAPVMKARFSFKNRKNKKHSI